MLERLIHAAISTAIIIVAVPLVGMLIEFITMEITRGLAKHMGVSTALFIMNGLTFVGTIHHELSHALYALITGAKVTNVEVFKPKDDRLGCVEFIPRGRQLVYEGFTDDAFRYRTHGTGLSYAMSFVLVISFLRPSSLVDVGDFYLFGIFHFHPYDDEYRGCQSRHQRTSHRYGACIYHLLCRKPGSVRHGQRCLYQFKRTEIITQKENCYGTLQRRVY